MMRCGLPPYAGVKPGPLHDLFGFKAVMGAAVDGQG